MLVATLILHVTSIAVTQALLDFHEAERTRAYVSHPFGKAWL